MAKTTEERIAQIREHWFPEHKATYHGPFDLGVHKDVEYLTWKKDGTNCYFVEYWAVFNRLIVSGDIGDAIYGWPEEAFAEEIVVVNLDYTVAVIIPAPRFRNRSKPHIIPLHSMLNVIVLSSPF